MQAHDWPDDRVKRPKGVRFEDADGTTVSTVPTAAKVISTLRTKGSGDNTL